MKISYTYKEYANFPEATEISESRERTKRPKIIFLVIACFVMFNWLLGGMFETVFAYIAVILCLCASIAALVYMFTKYDEVTEKKIKKAIIARMQMMNEVADSKYKCKSLKTLGEAGVGKCLICYKKDVVLAKYRIKNNVGTRDLAICGECITKLQENCES